MTKYSKIILMIGQYFLDKDENYIISKYFKNSNSVSNALYEKKLISGFKTVITEETYFIFLSAPAVGWWPINSKKLFVNNFSENDFVKTTSYCAIFGLCNFFKTRALINKIRSILGTLEVDIPIHVICSEAHKPYLECVKYLKQNKKQVFSTLIVPDLPDDMFKSKNIIYKLFKKRDVKNIYKYCNLYIDSFVTLTDEINNKININKKPFLISQGIISKHNDCDCGTLKPSFPKHCVFVGKTDKRNGIEILIEAAKLIDGNKIIIDIYGSGDADPILKKINSRSIVFHGFLAPSFVYDVLKKADILLSTRLPDDGYTNFSFPSKIFDYLSLYKPIITYKLPCYFPSLDKILIYPKNTTPECLAETINDAAMQYKVNKKEIDSVISEYSSEQLAKRIINLFNN